MMEHDRKIIEAIYKKVKSFINTAIVINSNIIIVNNSSIVNSNSSSSSSLSLSSNSNSNSIIYISNHVFC